MKRVVISTLLILFLCGGLFAQADLQVLAVVKLKGSEAITLGALKNRVAMFEKQRGGVGLSVAEKKEVLNAMIDEKLVLQAAEKEGIVITDSQVDQAFQNFLSNMAGQPVTEKQFDEILRKQFDMSLEAYVKQQTGLSLPEYKKQLKNQLISQQYILGKKSNEIKKGSVVKHEEITSYYNNHPNEFVQPEMATLFMVLVPKGKDSAAAKKSADDLLASLKKGKLDRETMIEKSKNGEKAYQAGYVYVARRENAAAQIQMPQSEFDSLFTKKFDVYSNVSELPEAYRFYTVTDKSDVKILTLNDIVQPNTTVTVYKYIENVLGMQKQNMALMQATQDLTNELREGGNLQMNKSGADLDKLLNW